MQGVVAKADEIETDDPDSCAVRKNLINEADILKQRLDSARRPACKNAPIREGLVQ
jgi:hypothetical protein